MKTLFIITTMITLVFNLSSCSSRSCLESEGGLDVIHLEGTPFEQGLAHGKLLKEEIGRSIDRWKTEVETTFQSDLNTLVGEFFDGTDYLESIREYDPGLLEEVYGMSEASGINYSILLAFQMSEEMFAVLGDKIRVNCTSIGQVRTDSSFTLLAQNMDPPPFLHGHPLLMHVIPGGGEPERYLFTVPGLLGLAGLNDRGIGVTCNGISMLNHDTTGLPVVSVVRYILARENISEAVAFIKEVHFAIPQCYSVGGPGAIHCFECSPGQVAGFYPFGDTTIVLHTNHSIRNRDFNQDYLDLLAQYGKTADDPYFCPRYFLAYDEIEASNRELDVARIREILRLEQPEMEPILNRNTLGTLIMKLDTDPTLFLALGQDPGAGLQRIRFD